MIALIKHIITKLLKRGNINYLSFSKFVSGENISIINSFNSQNTLQETNSARFLWIEKKYENSEIATELKRMYENHAWNIHKLKNFLETESWVMNIVSGNKEEDKWDAFNWLISLLDELEYNGYVIDSIEQIDNYINSPEDWLILLSEWFYHAFRYKYFTEKKRWKVIIISDSEIKDVDRIILSRTIQENNFPRLNTI